MSSDFTTESYLDAARKLLPGSHIHFIGIGGSSMNGLARIAQEKGYTVSGSDRSESAAVEALRSSGITVSIPQSADNITPDIDLVIYTVAISDDNPELVRTLELGIPVVERAKYLGILSEQYPLSVAVCGTHGKTTTTAMLGSIFLASDMDPAIHMGGNFPLIGGSVRTSKSNLFVTEACEYHAHMLNLKPFAEIILNIEAEHLDFYKDINDIKLAFLKFVQQCRRDGLVVAYIGDSNVREVTALAQCHLITYAFRAEGLNAAYEADEIEMSDGKTHFTVLKKGEPFARITLSVPGRHNILNALAASACADMMGAPVSGIVSGLAQFTGTGRRFEKIGTHKGADLIDDYAHHPTEIAATLKAARSVLPEGAKLHAVFQAHTFSRAITFQKEFAEALSIADDVTVLNIYSAREQDTGVISGASMTSYFRERGIDAAFAPDFAAAAEMVSGKTAPGDIIISLGAGDGNSVIYRLMAY